MRGYGERAVIAGMLGLCAYAGWAAPAAERVPIIYSTDLYHPHDDPDDHYDLLTLFAEARFDLRAVVLDQGPRGAGRLGVAPLRQVMAMTGRAVPYAGGLTGNLVSEADTAEGQPRSSQEGVALILAALAGSEAPVTLFTTGSLRDVAAAYNRDPALLQAKVARLYVNAGHSAGGREWNVDLEPHAYWRIMKSPLPVYWVPCFGEERYRSLWQFTQGELLAAAPEAVQDFILFALARAVSSGPDPVASMRAFRAAPDVRARAWQEARNMWCTAAFLHAAGAPMASCGFVEAEIEIDPAGAARVGGGPGAVRRQVFRCSDPAAYPIEMRRALGSLLGAIGPRPGE